HRLTVRVVQAEGCPGDFVQANITRPVVSLLPRLGTLVEREGHDPCTSAVPHGDHRIVVRVEDRDAAILRSGKCFDELALGLGDRLPGAELPEVRATYIQLNADLRRCDRG